MKFVTYNIQYGFGQDGRYDLARAIQAIGDADVIALQEVERHWPRTGFDDQPALIAAMLPEHYWVYGPAFDMDASFRDEAARLINRRRQFGTMLVSRWPIVWSRLHLLPMRRMTARLNTQNPALEGMIRTPAGPLRVFSLHLAHIDADERREQIDWLLAKHRRVSIEGGPWSGADDEAHRDWTAGEPEPEAPEDAVWMGDFNMLPESRGYAHLARNGFVDAETASGGSIAKQHSHVRPSGELRRLDYCFMTERLAPRVIATWVDETATGSDHLPVWTEIEL